MQTLGEDEIIYSARYTPWRIGLATIVYTFSVLFMLALGCTSLSMRNYFFGCLLLLAVPGLIPLLVDTLSFEKLVFYPDRVEKVWRSSRSKTIYYSNSRIADTRKGWLSIMETDAQGKWRWKKSRIMVQDSLFSSEARRKVNAILGFLTEDKRYGNGIVKESRLERGFSP